MLHLFGHVKFSTHSTATMTVLLFLRGGGNDEMWWNLVMVTSQTCRRYLCKLCFLSWILNRFTWATRNVHYQTCSVGAVKKKIIFHFYSCIHSFVHIVYLSIWHDDGWGIRLQSFFQNHLIVKRVQSKKKREKSQKERTTRVKRLCVALNEKKDHHF